MTHEHITLLRQVAASIVSAVKAAGPIGAPGGVMYAALMAQGCSLNQFEQIMGGMVRAGVLSKRGDCYHLAAK